VFQLYFLVLPCFVELWRNNTKHDSCDFSCQWQQCQRNNNVPNRVCYVCVCVCVCVRVVSDASSESKSAGPLAIKRLSLVDSPANAVTSDSNDDKTGNVSSAGTSYWSASDESDESDEKEGKGGKGDTLTRR
jgi:hypothetical protein